MSQLVDLFINHLSAEKKAICTTDHYAEVLHRFESWLLDTHNLSLTIADAPKVTGLIMVEYYQTFHQKNLKVATRNNYTVILKEFFQFLVDACVVCEDPTRALHCLKEKKNQDEDDDKEYSPEELKELLDSMCGAKPKLNDLRDAAIVALILGSGLRASEACSLNISDSPAIKNGLITCRRKGNTLKKVEVSDFVWPYVERYLWRRGICSPDDPMFLSQQGNRMNRNSLWKTLAAKQRNIGIATGVHKFHHTFASDVDRNPIGGAAVSRDLAGHKSISITNTYLHSSHAERQQVVNSMGYADLFNAEESLT